MKKGALQIHSENILPIIKKWLYSDRDIFVRELISNSCDAIQKTKILRDQGALTVEDTSFQINVVVNRENRTLSFIDNGIGMTEEEVKKYITQIAFSGAEEFLSKYTSNQEQDQIIGHFGLGFYSAYMVAKQVEIQTRSYLPDAAPVKWTCDGSSEYTIELGSRATRGTEIILSIDPEHDECLDTSYIQKILKQYCSFLPYPIYLDGKLINEHFPLWVKSPSECSQEDYLKFYHELYPTEEDPLFWIHLNVDYPFRLKGILYFPKIRRDFDPNKSGVQLYCNRVFVSDQCKDIVPQHLLALRGIIDSPDIPLNVSRSYLQIDKKVRQLSGHISKKVNDSLLNLYRNDRERFLKAWNDVSVVVKFGLLEDPALFEKTKDFLVWKTTSDRWVTLDEYLESNGEKTGQKILYTTDPTHAKSILDLYTNKGIDVLAMMHPIDSYLIHSLEQKIQPAAFQRIDAELSETLIDKEREQVILNAEGRTQAACLADLVKSLLEEKQIEVQAKSLATDSMAGFIMIDEKKRRMRDYLLRMQDGAERQSAVFLGSPTFVINTNSPLVQSIEKLHKQDPALAKEMAEHIYDLSLLSQREMSPEILQEFVTRSNHLLSSLAQTITSSSQATSN